MRHPCNYAVNEGWIVFRLNEAPVRTEREGGTLAASRPSLTLVLPDVPGAVKTVFSLG